MRVFSIIDLPDVEPQRFQVGIIQRDESEFRVCFGGLHQMLFRYGSVLHDVACDERIGDWQDVALMFYRAMRCSAVDETKAKIMYYAVYQFGPRWTPSAAAIGLTCRKTYGS